MTERSKKLAARLALVIMLAASVSSLSAKGGGVAGNWTMSCQGMSMTMVLAQKGKAITGTLQSPHGPIQVKGEFDKGTLTLSGSLEGGAHALDVSAKGALQKDGTLAGDLVTSTGNMAWTAARDTGK